jgi:hypothetical protein
MSAAVAFDTLKFVERLEAGGFTHEQAKAAAEAFAAATGEDLATKADLKAEIASVRSDIRELELRMTIKLGGLIMAATGVILAAFKFVN